MRALLDNVRASVPEFRRAAVDAEAAALEAAAARAFADPRDQRAAAASDRQGLGATEVPAPRPPLQAGGDREGLPSSGPPSSPEPSGT
jgi:hypothetical protein